MRHATTLNWSCDRCGTKGHLTYDSVLSSVQAYAAVLKDHRIAISAPATVDVVEHLQAIHYTLRRKRAPSSQQSLFE